MRLHGIPLWRWISSHRYELALTSAIVLVSAVLLIVAPLLLAVGTAEWKSNHRRVIGLALLALLARSMVWLWQEIHGIPHGRWHPCAQCGLPIEAPSRAWYCSPLCRRYARLERDARSPDPWLAERAAVRLRVLARASAADPESSEIPF
jgi:hypothetical protein